jgi:hypothetical protein
LSVSVRITTQRRHTRESGYLLTARRHSAPPWLFPVRQSFAGLALTLYDCGKVSQADLNSVRAESLRSLPDAQPAGQPIGAGIFPGDGWTYYGLWQLDRRLGLPETQDKANCDRTWLVPAAPPDFPHM